MNPYIHRAPLAALALTVPGAWLVALAPRPRPRTATVSARGGKGRHGA